MSIETTVSLIGIMSGVATITFYFRWLILYSRNKGYSIAELFKNRIYKPFKIDEDKEIAEKERKRLNRFVIYFYLFLILAFLIAFIANTPIIRSE